MCRGMVAAAGNDYHGFRRVSSKEPSRDMIVVENISMDHAGVPSRWQGGEQEVGFGFASGFENWRGDSNE